MDEQQPANSGAGFETDPQRVSPADLPDRKDLSTREAAAILGISERTVRRAIISGDLIATRDEAGYHINRDSLISFAARVPPAPGPRPLAPVVAFPGNMDTASLPEPLSSFVGRSSDVTSVLALLDDPAARLITLTGTGGIGKTRLAMTVSRSIPRQRVPDGITFVALADVQRPQMVMPALAQALGLRTRAGLEPGEQLRKLLRRKQLLLVLDNFEQVLPAGREVAALLAEAPKVRVLVTSRAPLRVEGERELAVKPLTMASEGATESELLSSDAGRLFVERAREHDAAFTVDAETAPLIAGICAQLDGLPLAIELAAARTKILSLQQLHARLERRLPLLTRGARNAPSRHSTMRDAIAWSYELLSVPARRGFQRIAVFAGGATLDALEAVSRTSDQESDALSEDILDVVSDLTDQSLLVTTTDVTGQRRFHMLETIREFGLEQLAASGDEEEARTLHAHYFLALSSSLRPLASTQARLEPFDTLTAEYANLQEALSWLDSHGPAADFVALVADLCKLWYTSSFNRDARPWVERALPKIDQATPVDQGRLFVGYGAVMMQQGEFARAEPLLTQGLHLLREGGDALYRSRALILSAAVETLSGRYAEAETQLQLSLAIANELTDPFFRAAAAGRALTNLCCAARAQNDFSRARAYSTEALDRFAGRPFDALEASTLIDDGSVSYDLGDHDLALSRLLQGVALMGERGDMRQVADALSLIACIATHWDQPRRALLLFGAADALRERVGAAMVWPSDVAAVERSLSSLRETLGEQAVADMLAEGRTLSRTDAATIASELVRSASSASHTAAPDELTRRERDVLRLLAEHQSDREIAAVLFLSLRTVNWHVRSILAKLGAGNRREAIARARSSGIL